MKTSSVAQVNKDFGMSIALQAAAKAWRNEGIDPSNGAFWWDGLDFKTRYSKHPKVNDGFRFSDPRHMFSLRSNGLPCGASSLRSPQPNAKTNHVRTMPPDVSPRRSAGGRPKGDPAAVRTATIGVRVSAGEYAALRMKAAQMHMTPA